MTTTTTISPATLTAAVDAVNALGTELKTQLVERDGEVDAVLTALVAGEHVLLLGPWGTAKSLLANTLSAALGVTEFSILMTKHTTPEEVFGPFNLPALKEGRYERVTTGRFPEAQVAFLDEIFKSNSAILNGFLTALNERKFDNGGHRQDIPLLMTIGASNELPQDEGLGALRDRFLVSRWTRYVGDRGAMRRLLLAGDVKVTARVSAEQLQALHAARAAVDVEGVVDAVLTIRDEMAAEGMEVSDRRWKKALKLVQASAVLNGRQRATEEDLMPIADALWDAPDDAAKVYGLVARQVAPDLEKALKLLDSATELWAKTGVDKLDLRKPDQLTAAANVNAELKRILGEVRKLKASKDVTAAAQRVEVLATTIQSKITKHINGGW